MDSRLRSGYNKQAGNVALDTETRQRGFETNKTRPHSLGSHSLENVLESSVKLNGEGEEGGSRSGGRKEQEKKQARDVLVSKITEAAGKEKRLSNGIRMSPVSTKGEVTTTQSTKVSPPTTTTSSKSSTPTHKTDKDLIGGKKAEMKSRGEQRSQRDSLPSDSSSDTLPSVRPESSNSSVGGAFSPTDEFQYIEGLENEPLIQSGGSKGKTKHAKVGSHRRHGSTSSEELYDRLDPLECAIETEESEKTTPTPTTPTPSTPGILISQDNGNRWSMSSNESGEYDHLPALQSPTHGGKGREKISLEQLPSMLTAPGLTSYRRITSQPALSTPASARESPVDRSPSNSIIREETSEEEEEEEDELGDSYELGKSPEQGSELSEMGHLGVGVVLRKRNKHLDPFADILGSPHGASRLRWSQELNPLYDYIKGYKISESVKLYDSPSKLLQSTNASDLNRKSAPGECMGRPPAPSIIVEEESEVSSREQTCSPSESQGEGDEDTKSELELPHETSTLPRMRRPHVYEEISFADLPPEEERPSSEMGMVEKLKMKRALYEKEQKKAELKSTAFLIGRSDTSPIQRRKHIKVLEKAGVSPRIGKRELLQQRRSRTINSLDDTATEKRKQKSMRAGDALKVQCITLICCYYLYQYIIQHYIYKLCTNLSSCTIIAVVLILY